MLLRAKKIEQNESQEKIEHQVRFIMYIQYEVYFIRYTSIKDAKTYLSKCDQIISHYTYWKGNYIVHWLVKFSLSIKFLLWSCWSLFCTSSSLSSLKTTWVDLKNHLTNYCITYHLKKIKVDFIGWNLLFLN